LNVTLAQLSSHFQLQSNLRQDRL